MIGYRYFSIDTTGGQTRLISPWARTAWTAGWNTAVCYRQDTHPGTPPPAPTCGSCGMFFLATMRDAVARLRNDNAFRVACSTLTGREPLLDLALTPAVATINTRDDVQPDRESFRGVWRTGAARITHIWIPSHRADDAAALAATYGVDVTVGVEHDSRPQVTTHLWLTNLAPDADPAEQGCGRCNSPTYPICQACIEYHLGKYGSVAHPSASGAADTVWRTWLLVAGALASPFGSIKPGGPGWSYAAPGWQKAKCRLRRQESVAPPHINCGCGWHAWESLDQLIHSPLMSHWLQDTSLIVTAAHITGAIRPGAQRQEGAGIVRAEWMRVTGPVWVSNEQAAAAVTAAGVGLTRADITVTGDPVITALRATTPQQNRTAA